MTDSFNRLKRLLNRQVHVVLETQIVRQNIGNRVLRETEMDNYEPNQEYIFTKLVEGEHTIYYPTNVNPGRFWEIEVESNTNRLMIYDVNTDYQVINIKPVIFIARISNIFRFNNEPVWWLNFINHQQNNDNTNNNNNYYNNNNNNLNTNEPNNPNGNNNQQQLPSDRLTPDEDVGNIVGFYLADNDTLIPALMVDYFDNEMEWIQLYRPDQKIRYINDNLCIYHNTTFDGIINLSTTNLPLNYPDMDRFHRIYNFLR